MHKILFSPSDHPCTSLYPVRVRVCVYVHIICIIRLVRVRRVETCCYTGRDVVVLRQGRRRRPARHQFAGSLSRVLVCNTRAPSTLYPFVRTGDNAPLSPKTNIARVFALRITRTVFLCIRILNHLNYTPTIDPLLRVYPFITPLPKIRNSCSGLYSVRKRASSPSCRPCTFMVAFKMPMTVTDVSSAHYLQRLQLS